MADSREGRSGASSLTDDAVRSYLRHRGWEASRISCYDEEGVEGWRWSHRDIPTEFEAVGAWDEEPAVSDHMREWVWKNAQ